MITSFVSHATIVPLAAITQSSTSLSSSSTSSPSTGSSTPSTSSSTCSPARVSEFAREAMLSTSPTLTSSSAILIGESEALRRWRVGVEPSSSLFSISSTLSSTPTHTQLDSKLQLLEQAEQHFGKNNILQALQLLDLIFQESPNFPPALKMRLHIYRIKEALTRQLDPLFKSGKYKEVRTTVESIFKIQPCDHVAMEYMKAIQRIKEDLTTQLDLSFKSGKYKEARTTAEFILEIQPFDHTAISCMKAIRRKQIKVFKKHLKLLFNSNIYDEAKQIANILLDINPKNKYAQKYLNLIAIQQHASLPSITDQP